MAKLRHLTAKAKEKSRKEKAETAPMLEVVVTPEAIAGRFINHIQVTMMEEEVAIDLCSRVGDKAFLNGRFYLTVGHVKRLRDVLSRQLDAHDKRYGTKTGK